MSAHRNAKNSSTLSVTSVLRRLPRQLVKPVALLVSGAIALGGVSLAQSWMSADRADAVTFLNGWDGQFTRNQLWIKRWLDEDEIRAVFDPWLYNTFDTSNNLVRFDAGDTDNGTAATAGDTLALGPIFKHLGDSTLHMIDFKGGRNGGASSVYSPSGSVVNGVNISTDTPFCGLTAGWDYSAEVN
ncbi:MAG: hypothetical protein LBD70_07410, partial [Bifidobacteriaceae bacterium]|nr:hypothetical protein [Bifidobacteriaceae bacterium]